MSSYQPDDFLLMQENKNDKLCSPCSLCSSCVSNIYTCICLPFRICMGLTWIGSCGFFFYLGNLYNQEQEKIHNITDILSYDTPPSLSMTLH